MVVPLKPYEAILQFLYYGMLNKFTPDSDSDSMKNLYVYLHNQVQLSATSSGTVDFFKVDQALKMLGVLCVEFANKLEHNIQLDCDPLLSVAATSYVKIQQA